MFKKWLYFVLDILSPLKCIGCGKEREILCGVCAAKSQLAQPIKLGSIYSAANYHDRVIKKAIWLLKYRGARSVAEPLAKLIHARLLSRLPDAQNYIIVPLPLHSKRLRERGYNQSWLLAKNLSDKFKIPLVDNVLYKIKNTPSQVSIKNRAERLKNLNDSFSAKNIHLIKSGSVILIDDVTTTGATINEAARVLKDSGAKKVIGFTVARD